MKLFGLITCAATLVLTGCTAPADEQSQPPAPRTSHVVTLPPVEPGIHLTLVQQRLDEGTNRLDLRVENFTKRPLDVRKVGLDWPGYGTIRKATRTTVGAGATLDLPLELPRERCHVDVSAVPIGIAVARTRTIRDEVDDMGVRFAERLWRTGCAAQRIRRIAAFSYGAPWRREPITHGMVLATSLRIERRTGSEPITLLETQGSVLFDLQANGDRTLSSEEQAGNLPLWIGPGRCDQHARSQASQPFTFRVFLQLGDDPQALPLILMPNRAQQRALLRFLDDACTAHD